MSKENTKVEQKNVPEEKKILVRKISKSFLPIRNFIYAY